MHQKKKKKYIYISFQTHPRKKIRFKEIRV